MSSFSLFDCQRGLVVAPAGCGKTQTIVDALKGHEGRPVLILTHTNAGVAALRGRLKVAQVPTAKFKLATIDGWALRVVASFPRLSGLTIDHSTKLDYPAVQAAALYAVASSALAPVSQATYSRLVVDEYQDCSMAQHMLVKALAKLLPCCALGDPLQRIFDFRNSLLPNWDDVVTVDFPVVETFREPWRWINAEERSFGEWLLTARDALLARTPIDLGSAPTNVRWVQLPASWVDRQRAYSAAINAARVAKEQSILVIGDEKNRDSRNRFARTTPGLTVVEPVDLSDLVNAASRIEACSGVERLVKVLIFASEVMTDVNPEKICDRLRTLNDGRAKKSTSASEAACLNLARADSFANIRITLKALTVEEGRRVFRHHLLNGMLDALQRAISRPGLGLHKAAISTREAYRAAGHPLPKRAVGSTLLLKGLEAEHAVILNADTMNTRHLYVAISRASKSLTIFSASRILHPA